MAAAGPLVSAGLVARAPTDRTGGPVAGSRPILVYGEERLVAANQEVTAFGVELAPLVDELFRASWAAPGLGVAAPQVGVNLRLAVVDLSVGKDPGERLVLANPTIVATSGRVALEEGCLSFPGLYVTISRPRSIVVRAQDAAGEWRELPATDLLAQAICHEVDHLDGVLLVDHLRGLKRRLFLRRVKKLQDLGIWRT